MPSLRLIFCLLWGLSLGASCSIERSFRGPEADGSEMITPRQFPDLPVPRDYKLLSSTKRSWSFQRGKFRTGNLVYRGSLAIERLRKFLLDRLPVHGWDLQDESRPTRERFRQNWISKKDQEVLYVLQVEVKDEGRSSLLRYDLRTSRRPTVEPSAGGAASAPSAEEGFSEAVFRK